ncbi:hypothetical protein Asppvi_011252 [Aspergillus pseudoviridinutans]|uniref:Uncharacterized protein n=1 Tax=Aspergillus pseudoviridinutans TaxID=1517512 RepID=A0A9P3F0W2_9EURO|nr:uncharacterized protein Asppvi_011252 [Aspergillus pseudoviridinutans]GIJ92275.1 hypothetical protein Asppvi_011252 [Aspergillus pseudoviridinutans]
MEEQTQHSTPFTEFIHHSARGFQTWQELCTQVRREVLQAPSSTEIAYTSVSPEWGPLIVDSLDEYGEVRRLYFPISYNSVTETLLIKPMSTRLLGCHLNWMLIQERDWHRQNLVRDSHCLLRVSTISTYGRFEAPYSGSRKIPTFAMTPDNRYHPSFVIQCGDSEPKERLMDDMRLWLIGARPCVEVVVIIMYARKGTTNQVEGKAELYVRDANGNPVLQQEATIFPATQSECSLGISAGDLFGPVLPQDLDANTVLPLSINDPRKEARDAMVHMDLVPAT